MGNYYIIQFFEQFLLPYNCFSKNSKQKQTQFNDIQYYYMKIQNDSDESSVNE